MTTVAIGLSPATLKRVNYLLAVPLHIPLTIPLDIETREKTTQSGSEIASGSIASSTLDSSSSLPVRSKGGATVQPVIDLASRRLAQRLAEADINAARLSGTGLHGPDSSKRAGPTRRHSDVVYATSVDEALDFIQSNDPAEQILLNSEVCRRLQHDIQRLLGDSSLTTRISIIYQPGEIINRDAYAELGIETIEDPRAKDNLTAIL